MGAVVAAQLVEGSTSFFKKWAIPGLFFLYFRLFNTQLTVNKCSIYKLIFADDWIQTADLWYWKQLLYQLSHNQCQHLLPAPKLLYNDT